MTMHKGNDHGLHHVGPLGLSNGPDTSHPGEVNPLCRAGAVIGGVYIRHTHGDSALSPKQILASLVLLQAGVWIAQAFDGSAGTVLPAMVWVFGILAGYHRWVIWRRIHSEGGDTVYSTYPGDSHLQSLLDLVRRQWVDQPRWVQYLLGRSALVFQLCIDPAAFVLVAWVLARIGEGDAACACVLIALSLFFQGHAIYRSERKARIALKDAGIKQAAIVDYLNEKSTPPGPAASSAPAAVIYDVHEWRATQPVAIASGGDPAAELARTVAESLAPRARSDPERPLPPAP